MRWLPVIVLLASCGGASSNVVLHMGVEASTTQGTELETKKATVEGVWTTKGAYTAVRNPGAWKEAFTAAPKLPAVDFTKQTLLVAAVKDPKVESMAIERVIVTDRNVMHVYVDQSLAGEGCSKPGDAKKEGSSIDVAVVDKISDEVHFWVSKRAAPSCGGKPKAHVICKAEGTSDESEVILKVQPGAKLLCDSKPSVAGSAGTISDRAWALTERPFGSTAMMALAPDRKTASFVTYAFGKYTVRLQVSDPEAKGDEAAMTVEAATPKEGIWLEMGWTKFDRNDEIQGFPRVEMLSSESSAPLAKNCDPDTAKKPAWCAKALRLGTVTHLQLDPQDNKRYRFGVKYVDERLKGPVLCTRVYVLGAKLTENCDNTERKAGTVWDMGVLDMVSGQFEGK